jgi:hypothetical protein
MENNMRKLLSEMTEHELNRELEILDEIRMRGDFLSPSELALEDALAEYLQILLEKEGR